MTDEQQMVEEFHRTFDIVVAAAPTVPEAATQALRVKLIQEEFHEVEEAIGRHHLPDIAKELADLLYVVYGTAVSYGIDMEPVFKEVHRSNMSKVGGHKRADGKWVKPATYSPAAVEPILHQQASTLQKKAN
jgi:predicted HAD superfamily Cof-like phosphohydrolase